MELPADVEYVENANLFIWRPRGVLSEALVNNIIAFVREQEETLGRSFNRFTDLSALDAVDLNFNYVFHIALYRRLSYAGGKVKSAFYVASSDAEHYAKLHELLTDHSPLQVSIFTDSAAAALCFTLAGICLLVWSRQREEWVHLLFSCSAVAAGVIALLELTSMRA